jgi:hypothetical protein
MKNRKGLLYLWAEPIVASSPAWLIGLAKFGLKFQAEAGDLDPPVARGAGPVESNRSIVRKRSASQTELGGTHLWKVCGLRLTVYDGRR